MKDLYDDEYDSCEHTYATLIIRSKTSQISKIKSIFETFSVELSPIENGESILQICSEEIVESKDFRRHLDWVLDSTQTHVLALAELDIECAISIAGYWLSKHGMGGPTLSPIQMKKLGELNIELWFDFFS